MRREKVGGEEGVKGGIIRREMGRGERNYEKREELGRNERMNVYIVIGRKEGREKKEV